MVVGRDGHPGKRGASGKRAVGYGIDERRYREGRDGSIREQALSRGIAQRDDGEGSFADRYAGGNGHVARRGIAVPADERNGRAVGVDGIDEAVDANLAGNGPGLVVGQRGFGGRLPYVAGSGRGGFATGNPLGRLRQLDDFAALGALRLPFAACGGAI